MTGFEVYKLYLALKNHFDPSKKYDFFKYGGGVSASESSYRARRDRWRFEGISKKYGDKALDFLVANFSKDENFYVGQATKEEFHQIYLSHRNRIEGIEYHFSKELKGLLEKVKLENKPLVVFGGSGEHPIVLREFLAKNISLETISIIFCLYSNIMDKHSDPIWDPIKVKIKKYSQFLNLESKNTKEKFRNIFRSSVQTMEKMNRVKTQ